MTGFSPKISLPIDYFGSGICLTVPGCHFRPAGPLCEAAGFRLDVPPLDATPSSLFNASLTGFR